MLQTEQLVRSLWGDVGEWALIKQVRIHNAARGQVFNDHVDELDMIENFLCKLKYFKRVALRAEETDRCYEAVIYLAANRHRNQKNLNRP